MAYGIPLAVKHTVREGLPARPAELYSVTESCQHYRRGQTQATVAFTWLWVSQGTSDYFTDENVPWSHPQTRTNNSILWGSLLLKDTIPHNMYKDLDSFSAVYFIWDLSKQTAYAHQLPLTYPQSPRLNQSVVIFETRGQF